MNPDPLINNTIERRYVIERPIGRGGAGTVYQARDLALGRVLAIKFIITKSSVGFKRFEREWKALSEIRSIRLPEVYSWGRYQADTFYIVLELVEGETLEQMAQSQQLQPEEVSEIAMQICEGLAAIHERELVHRDLKPSNIMVLKVGGKLQVKILDLGLVHLLSQGETLTQSDAILGSFGYLSPEHASPSQLDARSDVFSLGCVLYRLFMGHPPCESETILATILKLKDGEFEKLPSSVPSYLQAIIYKCLAPKPIDRFQSADELRTCLADERTPEFPPLMTARRKSVSPALLLLSLSVAVAIFAVIPGVQLKNQPVKTAVELRFNPAETHDSAQSNSKQLLNLLRRYHDFAMNEKRPLPSLIQMAKASYAKGDTRQSDRIFAEVRSVLQEMKSESAKTALDLVSIEELELLADNNQSQFEKSSYQLPDLLSRAHEPNERQRLYMLSGRLDLLRLSIPRAKKNFLKAAETADRFTGKQDLLTVSTIDRWLSTVNCPPETSAHLLKPLMNNCAELLNESANNEACVFYLNRCLRLPNKVRGEKWTKALIDLVDKTIKRQSASPRRATFKLLKDGFAFDMSPTQSHRQALTEGLEQLSRCAPQAIPYYQDIILTINKKVLLPKSTLKVVLCTSPALSDVLLDDYTIDSNSNISTLQWLFDNLTAKSATETLIRTRAGARLASDLLRNGKTRESVVVVDTIINTGCYDDLDFVNHLRAMAHHSPEQLANLKLLFAKLQQNPRAQKRFIADAGATLACCLAKQGQYHRTDEIHTYLKGAELTQSNIREQLHAYAALGNIGQFETFCQRVRKGDQADATLQREILCQAIRLYSQHPRSKDKVPVLIRELQQTFDWITEDTASALCLFYSSNRDTKSVLALCDSVTLNKDLSDQQYCRTLAIIASSLAKMGDQSEADRIIELVRKNKSHIYDKQTVVELCNFYERKTDGQSLAALLSDLPQTADFAETRVELELRAAFCFFQIGSPSTAAPLLAKALASPSFKENVAFHGEFLQVCALRQDARGMLQVADFCKSSNPMPPKRASLLCGVARSLAEIGLYQEGQQCADEVRTKFAWFEFPEVASSLLEFYKTEGNIPALQSMLESKKLDKAERFTCLIYLASLLAVSGDQPRAKAILARLRPQIDWTSLTGTPAEALLDAYEKTGDVEALNQVQVAHCSSSLVLTALLSLAAVYCSEGRAKEADLTMEQIAKDTTAQMTRQQLLSFASLYCSRAQCEPLQRLYDATMKESPKKASAVALVLLQLLSRNSKHTDATQVLAEMRSLNQKAQVALRDESVDLAWSYTTLKDLKNLRDLYNRLRPDNSSFTRYKISPQLAFLCELEGQHGQADEIIADLKKTSFWSTDQTSMSLLSWIYHNRKDKNNLEILARAASNPNRVFTNKSLILTRLASVYYKCGQKQEANKIISAFLSAPSVMQRDFESCELIAEMFAHSKDKAMLSKLFSLMNRTLVGDAECKRAQVALHLTKLLSDDPAQAKRILVKIIADLQTFKRYRPAEDLLSKAETALVHIH